MVTVVMMMVMVMIIIGVVSVVVKGGHRKHGGACVTVAEVEAPRT